MRLVPYSATTAATLPVAPGWPHDDTAAALSFAASGAWTWLILDDDDRIVGECGVKTLPDEDGVVEIGYGLSASCRGRGLGTRAVTALLAELVGRPGVHAITAEIAAGNDASRRLLERLGFAITHARGGYVWYRRVV